MIFLVYFGVKLLFFEEIFMKFIIIYLIKRLCLICDDRFIRKISDFLVIFGFGFDYGLLLLVIL